MDNGENNSDFESDNIMPTSLPVADLPPDVDLLIPPATGEEYLARVRLEASKNLTVVADIDIKKYEKNRTHQFHQNIVVNEDRNEFKASLEWQKQECEKFANLVLKAERERSIFLKGDSSKEKIVFPKRKSDWYKFCFGKPKKSPISESADETNDSSFKENRPLLSILYRMPQSSVVQLFDYLVEWVEEYGYSAKSFEWIYAVMCFLEKPILPETYSSLRSLSRKCNKIRSELDNDNDERLNGLKLFIAIVAHYFSQSDLAD